MSALVSVVVPVFNGLPHLRELANSLLRQSYGNLEIVFSEGGGFDASRSYLHSINDPRVRLMQLPQGTSAAANWTAATEAASGEFTKLICQDDLLYPHAIERQVRDLVANPTAVMAVAQRDIVDAHGNVVYSPRGLGGLTHRSGECISGRETMRMCYLRGTNVLGEPLAVLFRTSALQSVMPWDDTDPLMLDLSTYQKVARLGDIVIRSESIGAFRVSAGSWSTRIARQQLDQTRRWQVGYAHTSPDQPNVIDRSRAWLGRHIQVTIRRSAYTYLRWRNRLSA